MGRDLGTYHARVEFENGDGFIQSWPTNGRFIGGGTARNGSDWSPLKSTWVPPNYESEDDVILGIIYMYAEGNYSCDCNKQLFLAYAHQSDHRVQEACGDTIKIKSLTIIRPDGSAILVPEEQLANR